MYYANSFGKSFTSFTNGNDFIFLIEGETVIEIYKNGNSINRADVGNFPRWIKEGRLIKAKDSLLKEYKLAIQDGYYGGADGKGFRVCQTINGKNRRSVYLMSRNGGDWETAMISGPDFINDFKRYSLEAAIFDEKVENGEWIKVEVEEKS